MKKALLVTDGLHDISHIGNFIIRLHREAPICLTAAFLPQIVIANTWTYAYPLSAFYVPPIDDNDISSVDDTIAYFKQRCTTNGIAAKICRELKKDALPIVRRESRFADFLLLNNADYYNSLSFSTPNDYLRETLHAVECPVILIPEEAEYPETTILAYDGSASSAYAIRSFTTLFPHWCQLPAMLIYLSEHGDRHLPYQDKILDLAEAHFPNLTVRCISGKSPNEDEQWLKTKRPILVSGSFGRSGLSQLFRRSFAASLAEGKKIPLFIAHQ